MTTRPARLAAYSLVAVALVVMGYMAARAVTLLGEGPLGAVLGVGVLLLLLTGARLLLDEVRLARAADQLGDRYADAGGTPDPDGLLRRPSGRLTVESAEVLFEARKRQAEERPQDWTAWYALALAYGAAGDTRAGRRTMRHAVALERATR